MKFSYLAVLALSMSFATAYAQSDDQVLNSDPINVDGYLTERQVTDGELEQIKAEIRRQKNEVQLNKDKTKGYKELSKTTEKLSDVTENFLDEKKSSQQEIADYNAKIKCLMEEDPDEDCDKYLKAKPVEQAEVSQPVSTSQAAPVVSTTEISGSNSMSANAFETIKLAFDGGVINYTSENEELRADVMGLRVESNITERFSMSVGANYTSFTTEDFANNMYGGQSYTPMYYGAYGMKGREIQYKSMGVEFGGKFFIVQTERFRPYLGAGLGYNMANLKYAQNNQNTFGQYSFGNEDYKTNFATGSLSLGTEIMITRRVGMNVQGAYSTALGSSLSSADGKNRTNSPDQRRLGQLGDEVINASALSLTAGLLVVF